MENNLYMFSFITGRIIDIEKWEVKRLFPYQIPLKSRPKDSCKHCYGRGYTSINHNGFYDACSCIRKAVLDGFDTSKVKLFAIK